ncbi:YbfB/YjiJ family MFS transporter [Labrenzia suaedae]|uniref:YbfB/YjiJ family MFS transporter n=2 Tax=Roseibium litorale TaxID=2803841 RepID=A0ABR9CT97_9HYPH|nr:YbfB/YjiJ family MFS transporter [Roseibium litorale]
MGVGRFVYTPILPFMVEGTGLSPAQAGQIATANFIGYLLGALAASMGGLRGSRRAWLLGALAISGLTSMAMSFPDYAPAAAPWDLWLFSLLRFVSGLASAFALVFASALVLDRLAHLGRPGLSALYFSGVGAGIAFSAVLVAVLNRSGASWADLWNASGLATLIAALAAALLIPGEPGKTTAPAASSAPSSGPAGMPPALIRLILAYGLFGFGYVITATFIAVIIREAPELAGLEAASWLVVGLTAAPSIFIWNKIALRLGGRRSIALACLLEAGGVALSVLSSSSLGILLAAALLGATFMGITAMGLMEARRLTRGDQRRILAVMTASFGLGQSLGPWLAGYLHQVSGGFTSASLAAAAALLLAAALTAPGSGAGKAA